MKSAREAPIIRVVKKKRAHKGHHGGAWKVAFADFMTSMMALFLVLWLITQSSEIRSAIAGYFQDPLGRDKEFGNSIMPGQGQSMVPTHPTIQIQPADGHRDRMLQLSEQIRQALDKDAALAGLKGHVAIEMTPDGLRISLLEDSNGVFFATGSPRPLPRAAKLIQAIGAVLAAATYPVTVEGHTDARPYPAHDAYTNWELSADRANAARRLLNDGGVTEEQIQAVRGFADRDPRVPSDPYAAQNRRVTILVSIPKDDGTSTTAASPPPPPPPPPAAPASQ
ncbi:MAG TPA: flagellar motor protein MotB [Gemmatimonadales bacterium]|nr:flagellar motor protein MotB [Gemmatimonadales bacterium]